MKDKILIANRGEIALDLISFFSGHGFETVLLSSREDLDTLASKAADKVIFEEKSPRIYLNPDHVIKTALSEKCRFIHPGYGYLATNPQLSARCAENGIVFIGPSRDQLEKSRSRNFSYSAADTCGISTVSHSALLHNAEPLDESRKIGFPLLIRPDQGYFNYGIQFCRKAQDYRSRFTLSQKEAFSLLGNQEIILEKYYSGFHAVEIPFSRAKDGRISIYPEMNISIQSRFKKLVLETPAPFISESGRNRLNDLCTKFLGKLDYTGVGSIEFLCLGEEFLFNGLNPFLPIGYQLYKKTYGLDLRQIQLDLYTSGEPTPFFADFRSYGLEIRIFAENWMQDFSPCPGVIESVSTAFDPVFLNCSFSTPLKNGSSLDPHYLPFIGKLCISGSSRDNVIQNAISALDKTFISGVYNTAPFLRNLLSSHYFSEGKMTLDFIDHQMKNKAFRRYIADSETAAVIASCLLENMQPPREKRPAVQKTSVWNVMGRLSQMKKRGL